MNIALFAVVWSGRGLRSAHFSLLQSRFGNLEDAVPHAWAGTPLTAVGLLPMEAGGSFCHSTEICFHSPVDWLQHCISAAFEQRKKPNENEDLAVAQSGMTHARPLGVSVLCLQCPIYPCTHLRPLQLVSCSILSGRTVQGLKPGQLHTATKR